jgi:hypothetical protein
MEDSKQATDGGPGGGSDTPKRRRKSAAPPKRGRGRPKIGTARQIRMTDADVELACEIGDGLMGFGIRKLLYLARVLGLKSVKKLTDGFEDIPGPD